MTSRLGIISAAALGVILALIVASVFLRKDPASSTTKPPSSSSPRREEKVDTIPERKIETPAKTEPDGLPDEPHRTIDFSPERGEISKRSYQQWMKFRDDELTKNLQILARSLSLPTERVQSLRALLDAEESLWRKDIEARLAPSFEGREGPKYTFTKTDEYRTFIDRITGDTDAQVRTLLDDAQLKTYGDWRLRLNQNRYYFTERK